MFRRSSCLAIALSVLALNASAQTWISRTSIPVAVNQPAVVTDADGLIHVIAGNSDNAVTDHQVYDPVANSWSTAAALPVATYGAHAALGPDGRLYVFGDGGIVHIYNKGTNSWSTSADFGSDIGWQSAGAFGPDGALYIFGGEDGEAVQGLRTLRYDPVGNSWSTRANLPEGRIYHGALLGPDALFYIFGGMDGGGEFAKSNMMVYDPAANSWSTGPTMPTPVTSFGYASYGGRFYVVGGSTDYLNHEPPYFNSVYVFNTATNSWSTLAQTMPTARRELGAAVSGNALYALGGSDGNALSTNEALINLPATAAAPVPTVSEIGMLLLAAALGAFALFALKR